MTEAMIVVPIVVVYLIVGGFTFNTLIHYDAFDEGGAAISAIFWPAVLPVAMGVWLAIAFREWRTRPKRVADALKPH